MCIFQQFNNSKIPKKSKAKVQQFKKFNHQKFEPQKIKKAKQLKKHIFKKLTYIFSILVLFLKQKIELFYLFELKIIFKNKKSTFSNFHI
jgi:hypothetical protein